MGGKLSILNNSGSELVDAHIFTAGQGICLEKLSSPFDTSTLVLSKGLGCGSWYDILVRINMGVKQDGGCVAVFSNHRSSMRIVGGETIVDVSLSQMLRIAPSSMTNSSGKHSSTRNVRSRSSIHMEPRGKQLICWFDDLMIYWFGFDLLIWKWFGDLRCDLIIFKSLFSFDLLCR